MRVIALNLAPIANTASITINLLPQQQTVFTGSLIASYAEGGRLTYSISLQNVLGVASITDIKIGSYTFPTY